jgi:hypothetical protein
MTKLEAVGLTPTDIHHIEYLCNKEVLKRLPGGFRWLKRNKREDAIVYFETFANWLEEKLLAEMEPQFIRLFNGIATGAFDLQPAISE